MICGSGGSKSRLAKAAGAEPAGHRSDEKIARRCGAKHISKSKVLKTGGLGPLLEVEMSKKCTPLWREAHFQVKMYKTHQLRTTFGSWDVEKVHAVVARSTFRSQNVQKHTILGPLLEVKMLKKCTPLWREAHSQVKMYKTLGVRTTFGGSDVEKVDAVVARSTFPSQNVQNTPCLDHFWKSRCWKSARRCGAKHISKSKCTKHTSSGPLLEVQMSKKCTPLWREAHLQVKMYKTLGVRTIFGGSDVASLLRFTTLHYVTLHRTPLYYTTLHYTTLHNTTTTTTQLDYTPLYSTTLNFTTLHYTALRSATLHYIKLHYTTLHYTTLHNTTTTTTQLHSTTLHYTKLHYTTLPYTTLHYTTLHYTTLHYTTLPSTTLHYITLHYTPLHYNYNYDYTTTLHYTKLHYTTLHYITLHYIPLHSTTLHYITLHYNTLNDTAPQIDR